jgi:hypothetical protein
MLPFALTLFAFAAVLEIIVAIASLHKEEASKPVALTHQAVDADDPNAAL